jgi:hypothetical protein
MLDDDHLPAFCVFRLQNESFNQRKMTKERNNTKNHTRAKKSNEVISMLLNDTQLQSHLQDITIQYNQNSETNWMNRNVIPGYHTVTSIYYKTHLIWKKGDNQDALTDGTIYKLMEYEQLNNVVCTAPNQLNLDYIDRCIKQFIIDGYMVILPEMLTTVSADMPDIIFQEAVKLQKKISNGQRYDSALEQEVPLLNEILNDPTVVTVMTRLLGDSYIIQPFSHMHWSYRGRPDQHFHKDNISGYTRPHALNLQLRNAMFMYYPQHTTLELGPTSIRRGSHYSTEHYVPERLNYTLQPKFYEMNLVCPKGSIVLMHYDLVHRRKVNTLTERYMVKFMMSRANDPVTVASYYPDYDQVEVLDSNYNTTYIDPLASAVWKWLHGAVN